MILESNARVEEASFTAFSNKPAVLTLVSHLNSYSMSRASSELTMDVQTFNELGLLRDLHLAKECTLSLELLGALTSEEIEERKEVVCLTALEKRESVTETRREREYVAHLSSPERIGTITLGSFGGAILPYPNYHLEVPIAECEYEELSRLLWESGREIRDTSIKRPRIHRVYLALTLKAL